MGPSGSGKTTLLDLLAGRKTVGKLQGDILFAGNKPTRPFLRRYTGYVEQFGESEKPQDLLAASSANNCRHLDDNGLSSCDGSMCLVLPPAKPFVLLVRVACACPLTVMHCKVTAVSSGAGCALCSLVC